MRAPVTLYASLHPQAGLRNPLLSPLHLLEAPLLIADLQPVNYTIIRRLMLATLQITTYAPNPTNSSCSGNGRT